MSAAPCEMHRSLSCLLTDRPGRRRVGGEAGPAGRTLQLVSGAGT